MTRSYPQPIYPGRAVIDVGAVQGLLLGAADAVAAAKALVDGSDCDPKLAVVLNLSIAVYGVVEGIIDKAIVPMNCPAAAGRNDRPPNQAPIPPAQPGKKELEDALETADLTAVVFGADLGGFPLANRDKLAEAFSVGLRSAALKKAEVAGTDMSEAVRVVDDALSCATDMAFLGQVSGPPKQRGGGPENDNRPSNNENEPRNTMPVRLIFPDRWSRIHFESTLREKTGMRANMSLPYNIRKLQTEYQRFIREENPQKIVVIRTDVKGLSFTAHLKEEGVAGWTQCGSLPIPPAIMLGEVGLDRAMHRPAWSHQSSQPSSLVSSQNPEPGMSS
jgi:hypothetical protein